MKYEIIWNGTVRACDDYDEAIECAKMLTLEEEKYYTALILMRSEDTVKLQAVRWIIFGMYELVNLTI